MLRAAIKAGTSVGMQAKSFIDKGELVPDSTMIAIIEAALSNVDTGKKVLLDGFPRTVAQAEALESKPATSVTRTIFFEIPEELLLARLTGRRTCKNCGASFHIEFVPPKKEGICDECGSDQLVQRDDDKAEVVQKRLEVYQKQTAPLLSYYESAKKLVGVNANQKVSAIEADLLKLFKD